MCRKVRAQDLIQFATMMESIAVEAIRQIPAFMLAIMAFYFYRTARKNESASQEPAMVPDELLSQIAAATNTLERIESDYSGIKAAVDDLESLKSAIEESDESIRSQLSNQKMALKEFGRVLSKTSEQTYTEFGSLEERLGRVEDSLTERGLMDDESRSAAA